MVTDWRGRMDSTAHAINPRAVTFGDRAQPADTVTVPNIRSGPAGKRAVFERSPLCVVSKSISTKLPSCVDDVHIERGKCGDDEICANNMNTGHDRPYAMSNPDI